MKWKKDKRDGTRQAKAGVFSCVVFQYENKSSKKLWEYGILVGDKTFKEGYAKTPEECMSRCEVWISKHIVKMSEELNK